MYNFIQWSLGRRVAGIDVTSINFGGVNFFVTFLYGNSS